MDKGISFFLSYPQSLVSPCFAVSHHHKLEQVLKVWQILKLFGFDTSQGMGDTPLTLLWAWLEGFISVFHHFISIS